LKFLTEKSKEGAVNCLVAAFSLVLDKPGAILHHFADLITTL